MGDWTHLLNELRGGHRGCDRVASILADRGVELLFGLPAESINALFDACRNQDRLRVTTVRHEGGASLMASAYGKLTGKVAAVTATNGPGVTHLHVGCRDALLDGAPMVVLAGSVSHRESGTQAFQEVDSTASLAAVTDTSLAAWTAEGLARLGPLITRAERLRRPVNCTVAPDVLTGAATAVPEPAAPVAAHAWHSSADAEKHALHVLDGSSSPVVVLGDVRWGPEGVHETIRESSAEVIAAPSAMQARGWSAIDQHGRLVGDGRARARLAAADLVVVVGEWPGEVLDGGGSRQVVHLTGQPSGHPRTPTYLNLCGDAARSVLDRLDRQTTSAVGSGAEEQVVATTFLPVMRDIDDVLPDRATVCLEPGAITDAAFLGLAEKERVFTGSFAAATRGYGIPAAVAAGLAFPDRPAVAIVDLSGWVEGFAEVLSARKHGVPVSVVVLVDDRERIEEVRSQAAALGLKPLDAASPGVLGPNTALVVPAPADALRTENVDVQRLVAAARALGRQAVTPSRPSASGPDGESGYGAEYPEAAGFVASGWAKAHGEAALLVVESEADFLRQLNGVHDAGYDSAPVVLATVETGWSLDAARVLQGLPVASMRIATTELDLSHTVERCLAAAECARGLVHLRVTPSGDRALLSARPTQWAALSRDFRASAAPSALGAMRRALRSAERPALLLGGGAGQAADEAGRLATAVGAPVVATMAGGVHIDTHPHFVGYVGSSGHPEANQLLRKADVVLALGVSNRGGAFELWGPECSVFDVNTDLAALESRAGATLKVQASSAEVLGSLLDGSDSVHRARTGWVGGLATRQRNWWKSAGSRPVLRGGLRPSYVVRVLDDLLSDRPEVTVTGDVGLNTLWLFRFKRSHATTLWTRNFASMGFALPAAAASTMSGDRSPAVAVMGDGGLGMVMPELPNLAEAKVPVLAIVLNNAGLGAIRYEQEISGWPEYESALYNGDFASFATACGWHGVAVRRPDQLRRDIVEFLANPRPTLLDVRCSADEPPIPASIPSAPRVGAMVYSWARQRKRGVKSAMSTLRGLLER